MTIHVIMREMRKVQIIHERVSVHGSAQMIGGGGFVKASDEAEADFVP